MTRVHHSPGVMNKTEALYSSYLNLLKHCQEIAEYAFEPETLRIGNDCRYTPDFRVLRPTVAAPGASWTPDTIEFHEVKGTRSGTSKPYIEDDALVKIKAAAALHPYKFVIVWLYQGKWMTKEIN